jgi:anti-sigma factor RsiW
MARLTQEELTRFHDGELSASERARIEGALQGAADGDLAHLEKLDKLGDFLRLMHEEQSSQVSFDGFAERVAAGIRAQEKPTAVARLSVWLSEFFEHRRIIWIPAASLVGAAAAVLIALPFMGSPNETSRPSSVPSPEIWTASAVTAQQNAVPRGSEASLSNRDQVSGMELLVSNERGESIGVVWVND